MLKQNLSDYSDAYILFKGTVILANTAAADADANISNIKAILKNWAPFEKCITGINITRVDDVQVIDVVISMHCLLEYSVEYISHNEYNDMGIY